MTALALPTIRTEYAGHMQLNSLKTAPVLAKRWRITESRSNPEMVGREFIVTKRGEIVTPYGTLAGEVERGESGQRILHMMASTHQWIERTGGPIKIAIEKRRMRDDSWHYWFSNSNAARLKAFSRPVGACLQPEQEGEGFYLKLLTPISLSRYQDMFLIEQPDERRRSIPCLLSKRGKIYIPGTTDEMSSTIKLVITRARFGYKTTLN